MKKVISSLLCAVMLVSIFPMNVFASNEPIYTMWGHNVKQSHIEENKNGTAVAGDEYGIKPIARYKKMYAVMEAERPSIIALQECDRGWHYLIDDYTGDVAANTNNPESELYGIKSFSELGYKSILEGHKTAAPRDVNTPIYYDANVFELVDSGVMSYYDDGKFFERAFSLPWAVLRAKATGKLVAFTSTHLPANYGGADNSEQRYAFCMKALNKIAEIENTYNCPVISMGDYNSTMSEIGCKAYAERMNVARYTAKETANTEYQTHNGMGSKPAPSNEAGSGQIDHCFYSKNGIAAEKWELVFETSAKYEGKVMFSYTYSDHTAQRLTFRLLGTDHKHTYGEVEQHDGDTHKTACTECYLYKYDEHSLSEPFGADAEDTREHYRSCTVCGYLDREEHSALTGEMIDDAVHSGLCPVCNMTGLSAHVYTYTQKDEESCVGTCACGHTVDKPHEYVYTSNGKGKQDTHTAICACGSEKTEEHVWDDGVATTPATYKADGVMTYTCLLCEQTRGEGIAKLDAPKDQYSLEAAGQKHYVIPKTEKGPKIDGRIKMGEYTLEIEDMTLENDLYDDRFYFTLNDGYTNDVSYFSIYVSHDEENLYLAARVADSTSSSYGDSVHFYVGNTDKPHEMHDFYIPRLASEGVEAWLYNETIANAQAAALRATDFVKVKKTVERDNVIVYELALNKEALGITDMDKIFFASLVTTANTKNAAMGNAYFGFRTEGLAEYEAFKGKFYPHVLILGEEKVSETEIAETEPVVTLPAETEPVETAPIAVENGCGGSVTALGIALIAMLTLCVSFSKKKK